MDKKSESDKVVTFVSPLGSYNNGSHNSKMHQINSCNENTSESYTDKGIFISQLSSKSPKLDMQFSEPLFQNQVSQISPQKDYRDIVCAVVSNPSADGMLIEDQEESNLDDEDGENYQVQLNVDNIIRTPQESAVINEANTISYNELFYNQSPYES